MKHIITIMLVIVFCQMTHAEMTVLDFANSDGPVKIRWEDMSAEQKARILEWQKENAEYILKNLDKKCSDLRDIPEYTRLYAMHSFTIPPKTFGPKDICFPSNSGNLVGAYNALGDYEREFAEKKKAHETDSDRLYPEKMAEWLDALISSGKYRDAEKFFPEFVHSVYPRSVKEEVARMIKDRKNIPSNMAQSIIADYWDRILVISNTPDDLVKLSRKDTEIQDLDVRIHRYFYSADINKKTEALEYYRKNKIRFMIEIAHNTWSGDIKNAAGKYLKEYKATGVAQ